MVADIFALIFPKHCAACLGHLLSNEQHICTVCRNELPVINPAVFTSKKVQEILGSPVKIDSFSSLFYFEKHTEVQELLHQLKYKNHYHLGKLIGEWHASILLQNNILQQVDMVIPTPIHKKRLRERGYNQVLLYAETLANALNVVCEEDILIKTTYKKSQVFLSRKARFNNILESLAVTNGNIIHGKHILLVDDLITTGATMSACVSCLKQVECEISIASMALVPNGAL